MPGESKFRGWAHYKNVIPHVASPSNSSLIFLPFPAIGEASKQTTYNYPSFRSTHLKRYNAIIKLIFLNWEKMYSKNHKADNGYERDEQKQRKFLPHLSDKVQLMLVYQNTMFRCQNG